MVVSNPASPANFGLAGTFSADDISELLGAMSGEHQQQHESTLDPSEATSASPFPADSSVNLPSAGDGIDDDAKAQSRSERKRSREKQRRSDVNRQFADLTTLLRQIETEEAEEDHTVARLAFSPTNRVDLIARTITHLERLRDMNKRRKKEVESLEQQLELSKKAGEETASKLKEVMFNQPPQNKQVMMMVPMMVSADGTTQFGAAPGSAAMMPMMNQFVMPHPFMNPHMQPVASAPSNTSQNSAPAPMGFPGFSPVASAPAPTGQSQNSNSTHYAQFAQNAPAGAGGTGAQTSSAPAPILPAPPGVQHIQLSQYPMSFLMPNQGDSNVVPATNAPVGANATSTSREYSSNNGSGSGTGGGGGESKVGSPQQQGMRGGSNLAHCA